jgi:hypothetical protein
LKKRTSFSQVAFLRLVAQLRFKIIPNWTAPVIIN